MLVPALWSVATSRFDGVDSDRSYLDLGLLPGLQELTHTDPFQELVL